MFATAGSRGDVAPFVALARRARDAGHEVVVVAPDNSGAEASDVDVRSLGVDFSAMIRAQGVSPLAAMRSMRDVVRPMMNAVIVGAARIGREIEPDVVVSHPKIASAPLIAEAGGIPYVLVETVPAVTPTREFPAAGTVTANVGPLNRLTYRAAAGAVAMFARDIREAAELLGVDPRAARRTPDATLLPVSPQILPRPADWPPSVHLTGAWRDPSPLRPLTPEVADFVAAGDYVYAGFGSMAAGDAASRGRAIVAAARRRGLRVLAATGLGGLDVPASVAGDDVLAVEGVDHRAVLPGAVAAIHHGGAGTVHAAAEAGTVSIVVPFIADQPFWGARLRTAGLAPAPIPYRRLDAGRVGAALDDVGAFQARADEVARAMAGEDGTAAALAALEALA